MLFITVWSALPFMIIVLLSSLQSVPSEQYEAASIDGAGFFQSLFNITLPGIKNISLVITLLMFVWVFNSTEMILLLTGGGPLNATTTLPVAIYRVAIKIGDFGYGSALAVTVLVAMIVIGILYLRLQEEK